MRRLWRGFAIQTSGVKQEEQLRFTFAFNFYFKHFDSLWQIYLLDELCVNRKSSERFSCDVIGWKFETWMIVWKIFDLRCSENRIFFHWKMKIKEKVEKPKTKKYSFSVRARQDFVASFLFAFTSNHSFPLLYNLRQLMVMRVNASDSLFSTLFKTFGDFKEKNLWKRKVS